MGVSSSGRADDFHLFIQRLFEFALQEPSDSTELDVNNVLLQSLRVPEGQTHTFAVNLGFKVMGGVSFTGGVVAVIFDFVGRARRVFVRRQLQGLAEEIKERSLP